MIVDDVRKAPGSGESPSPREVPVSKVVDVSERSPGDPVDDEEIEVMRLIAEGLKDHAIARRLGVSVVTVRRRAQRFRTRIGASNRIQAVALAASRGLLYPDPVDERESGVPPEVHPG